MSQSVVENYLTNALLQFKYAKQLAEGAIRQLASEELFWQYNDESNSIAVIIKHLRGNMLSRWTDFLTTDGEKKSRHRDTEFELTDQDRDQLIDMWEEGWACLFAAIEGLNVDNFGTKVFIRNNEHTVLEAINRQIAHISYHVGQITYIARMIKGPDWQSLSIPKGQSEQYFQERMARGKRSGHFTKDAMKK